MIFDGKAEITALLCYDRKEVRRCVLVKNHDLRGYLCAGGGAVIWGLSGVVGQYLLVHYDVTAYWITSVRMAGAGVVLLALTGRQLLSLRSAVTEEHRLLLHLIGYGIFGLMLSQLAFYSCIQFSNAGTATILQTLSVVMMAVIVCFTAGRRPYGRESLSILLALVGVFLISTHGDWRQVVLSPLALTWGLLAAVGCVCYSFLAISLVRRWGSIVVNALGMLIGGLALAAVIQPWRSLPSFDGAAWGLFAAIILIGTVLTYILFLRGVGDIGPIKATLLGTLEPLSSALCSAIFLGTVFQPAELIGFVCIILTVFLVMAQKRVTG